MRRRCTFALIALVAVAALTLAAGCSQPGGNAGGGSTPASGSAGGGGAAGGGQKVVLKDFSFQPANLEVTVGSQVTWENQDSTIHTVTSDDGAFSSQQLDQGKTFSFTFDKAGTYKYHCSIHPSMVGQIVVK